MSLVLEHIRGSGIAYFVCQTFAEHNIFPSAPPTLHLTAPKYIRNPIPIPIPPTLQPQNPLSTSTPHKHTHNPARDTSHAP